MPRLRIVLAACCVVGILVVVGLVLSRRSPPPAPPPTFAIPKLAAHAHLAPLEVSFAMRVYAREGVVGFANFSGGTGPLLTQQLAAARGFPGRVRVFANWEPRGFLHPGWVERELVRLREAKQQGAVGLKIYKALGLGFVDPAGRRVTVDDPRLDPLFEECGRLGMPVAIHSGDPKAFFDPPTPKNERFDELSANPGWSFHGPPFPTWEEVFGEYERRVARHPGTTFVGVHFGNAPEDPERVADMLRRYPNLYVDTAARVPEIGRMAPERLRAIFIEHRKRILFGTDFSVDGGITLGAPDGSSPGLPEIDRFFSLHWRFFETYDRAMPHPTPIQGRWTVDALGLPEDVLHDVYHRNAERLYGFAPVGEPAAATP